MKQKNRYIANIFKRAYPEKVPEYYICSREAWEAGAKAGRDAQRKADIEVALKLLIAHDQQIIKEG